MEVTFYNKINPNVILWNSSSNKRLCKFTDGIYKTGDKKVIEKLITLKNIEYDKKELENYNKYLEQNKKVEKVETKKEKLTKEKGDSVELK